MQEPAPADDRAHAATLGWLFHSCWQRPDRGPYPSRMSPDAHLSLSEGQEHDVSEWERFRWLAGKIVEDGLFNVNVLPQLHVLAWGNKRGV